MTLKSVIPAFLFGLIFCANGNGQAPVLTNLYPAGAQKGTTTEIIASCTFKTWPPAIWTSDPEVTVKPGKKSGHLTVTVSSQARLGICWIRFSTNDGASGLRPFLIGQLNEISEKEPNEEPSSAQVIPSSPFVINGKLEKRGDVDLFALELKKGQTLVASMEANQILKSPMDGVLQIVSNGGFVLAQNDDAHGMDPQIEFSVPETGRYYVRTFAFPAVADSSINFAGADTFIYRLTLTTEGFADHAFPLALERAKSGEVEMIGWNISSQAKKQPVATTDNSENGVVVHAGIANPVPVRFEDHPIVVEKEDKKPQTVSVPVSISGHIAAANEVDTYEFQLKKGQKLQIQVESAGLGSPLDPVLTLKDAGGKEIKQVESKTIGKDPSEISISATTDSTYRIEVKDLHDRGGMRFFYLLRLAPPTADFSLKVAKDQFAGPPKDSLEIPVTIERSNGFGETVEILAIDLPAGITSSPVDAGGKSKTVNVVLKGNGQPLSGAFRIVGRPKSSPRKTHAALATITELERTTSHLWVTLSETAKAPGGTKKKKK